MSRRVTFFFLLNIVLAVVFRATKSTMANYRKHMDLGFVTNDDPVKSYHDASRQVISAKMPQRGRKSGSSRRGHQARRSDAYRLGASQITENDLSLELKNKLFPGVKDGQSAADRLEAYNTESYKIIEYFVFLIRGTLSRHSVCRGPKGQFEYTVSTIFVPYFRAGLVVKS